MVVESVSGSTLLHIGVDFCAKCDDAFLKKILQKIVFNDNFLRLPTYHFLCSKIDKNEIRRQSTILKEGLLVVRRTRVFYASGRSSTYISQFYPCVDV